MTDFTLHRRAQDCIAQGYLTNSKRPEALVKGVYPTHVLRGQGCHLWDTSGKTYMDFICGLGTNLLGYGNESLVSGMSGWLRGGWSHSLATHVELETAEKLKECFPFVDLVKFLKSGSEACSAAIRIARAATGRNWVLSEGYHGHHDPFVSLTPPAVGVPKDECRSNLYIEKLGGPKALDSAVAAVIVEPVITDWSNDRRKWLEDLQKKCQKVGALLIFDEVITGFRWPRFGVSGYWNIIPDLIVLGKALAGGMPLAAVGGKKHIMNGAEYFISSTYAGETLSLAAAKTTMTLLQSKYRLQDLWDKGERFVEKFNSFSPDHVRIEGYPTRGILSGPGKALFMQEACKAGMLFGPSWFWSFPLAEAAPGALGAIESIIQKIKFGLIKMEGEPPQSPFAQRVREQ